MRVNNRADILSHGDIQLRSDLLDILSTAVDAVDPGLRTEALVRIQDGSLFVGDDVHHLDAVDNIYFIGTGKGSFPIAEQIDKIIGERISAGILAVKTGETRTLQHIRTIQTGHPIPNANSITAAREILDIVNRATERDIVIAAITGGATAMTVLPPEGLTLEDIQQTNDALLKSGATIREMNTVRRHLCQIKGGRLVKLAQPAMIYTLTLDTVSDDIMPWPDMSKPDPTTFQDALDIISFYGLADTIPPRILDYFCESLANPDRETVKCLDGMRQALLSVGNPRLACASAAKRAAALGYAPMILATHLEGESYDAGIFLAGVTNNVLKHNEPLPKPCALITGGETTVTIHGPAGAGGPNMEVVLSFLNYMNAAEPWACAAIDTDGTDGPTEYAGAICDYETKRDILAAGFVIKNQLKQHASLDVFMKTGNLIQTGHTGTNVMNLRVVLVGRPL